MAFRAADAFVYVNTVIEINEVGQVVNARPGDRASGAVAFAHGLQSWARRPHLRVTVHANLSGGKIREGRRLHGRMTVAAIDAKTAYMVLMTEGHGLFSRLLLARQGPATVGADL